MFIGPATIRSSIQLQLVCWPPEKDQALCEALGKSVTDKTKVPDPRRSVGIEDSPNA